MPQRSQTQPDDEYELCRHASKNAKWRGRATLFLWLQSTVELYQEVSKSLQCCTQAPKSSPSHCSEAGLSAKVSARRGVFTMPCSYARSYRRQLRSLLGFCDLAIQRPYRLSPPYFLLAGGGTKIIFPFKFLTLPDRVIQISPD